MRANGAYSGGVVLGVAGATHDTNSAARFDGGNDKVSVPDQANGSLDFGADDFTIEAWTKAVASDERGVISKRSANAAEPYWDVTVTDDPNHNGKIRAVYFDGTNTRTAYSGAGVIDGLWHHVVVWYDRDGGITIFVDGVARFTQLSMTPDVSNSGAVEIAKSPAHPYFHGDLDEIALYSGLLPLARIQAHIAAS